MRDERNALRPAAHIIIDGSVSEPVTVATLRAPIADRPGEHSKFNATLLHEFLRGNPGPDLETTVRQAAQQALRSWANVARGGH